MTAEELVTELSRTDGAATNGFCLLGEPIAKPVNRANDAEQRIAAAVVDAELPRYIGNVAVAVIFYRSNWHRIDVDNLLKMVLDGVTRSRAVWDDDSHVTAALGVIEYDAELPRMEVAFAPHNSTLPRGPTSWCKGCGEPFRQRGPNGDSRYCSKVCLPRQSLGVCGECGGPTCAERIKRCARCYNASRKVRT